MMIDTKPAIVREWNETETLDAFAEHLKDQSWCLEMSGAKPRLLHADSNYSVCMENLTFAFSDWAVAEKRACKSTPDLLAKINNSVSQRLPRVWGSSFRPTNEVTFMLRGARMANTYRPFSPTGSVCPVGLAFLDELAKRLVPADDERKIFLQFYAHLLARPEIRPQWGLLITGEGGTGKSIFVGLIQKALGNRACWRENSFTLAFKNFSEVLPNNLLVAFDDAPVGGSTYEQLKHAITSEFQEVEVKGQQRRVLREVFARIVILSNERNPFDLSEDRRFFVPRYCTHLVSRDESADFFRRLSAWSNGPDCAITVQAWLRKVDLSDFDVAAPVITDTHASMSSKVAGDLGEVVAQYVADERIVHADEVAVHVAKLGGKRPSRHDVETALATANYSARRRPHPKRKGQVELWVPSRVKRGRALTLEELQRMDAAGALR